MPKTKKTNKAILGVSVVSFNFIKLLNEHTTGSNWHEVQGPSSGCGLDYWYEGDIMGTKYAK